LRAGIAVFPETILQPIHHYLYQTGHLHPVAAVTLSVILAGLWTGSIFVTIVIPFANEQDYTRNPWYRLVWAEAGLQIIIVVLYLVYMGFSAHAVRLCNRRKKDYRTVNSGAGGNIEPGKVARKGEMGAASPSDEA
jgi:Ni,Fe-hydrogenase I cytochrome b subunit